MRTSTSKNIGEIPRILEQAICISETLIAHCFLCSRCVPLSFCTCIGVLLWVRPSGALEVSAGLYLWKKARRLPIPWGNGWIVFFSGTLTFSWVATLSRSGPMLQFTGWFGGARSVSISAQNAVSYFRTGISVCRFYHFCAEKSRPVGKPYRGRCRLLPVKACKGPPVATLLEGDFWLYEANYLRTL
jgi:hypothetical protein